jgi:hypothetical protein
VLSGHQHTRIDPVAAQAMTPRRLVPRHELEANRAPHVAHDKPIIAHKIIVEHAHDFLDIRYFSASHGRTRMTCQ